MANIEQFLLYVASALAAGVLANRLARRLHNTTSNDLLDGALIFLIRDEKIVDANFQSRRLLDRLQNNLSEFDRILLFLSEHFSDARRLVETEESGSDLLVQSRDGRVQAVKQTSRGTVRLKIEFVDGVDPSPGDIHILRAVENELRTLRANTLAAPFLLWRQNTEGRVVWANQAYLDTALEHDSKAASDWPLPSLFPSLENVRSPMSRETRRLSLPVAGKDQQAWFDCHLCQVGAEILVTAVPADEAVEAENRRREFTQTLTKTFAELAIGLAIFDRSRQLVLFNPALLDLTSLATNFLTSRPSLYGFLDQLRENRVMPEPRNYKSWRASIAELESAAANGTYSETWSLPDGQIFHVTGRPHPDGAVALLFEDISAEMSLTRHFRSELEQYQSVIDAFEDAVAVFSPAGDITTSNRAYRELWGVEHEDSLIDDVAQATRRWHELSAPTPVWGDFRDFAQGHADREEWTASVVLRDGRRLACRFSPNKGGSTMAMFRIEDTSSALQAAV